MERMRSREKKEEEKLPVLFLLKCLLAAYILTAGALLLLALLVYKLGLPERFVSVTIIAIYVASTFFAGFLAGKRMCRKKFLWGLLAGAGYFFVLAGISLIVNHSLKDVAMNFFTVLILCGAGGMLGGMVA